MKPIIFSAPMVRKILDGEKRQTRRPTKRQPLENRVIVHDDSWLTWCLIDQSDRLPSRDDWDTVKPRYNVDDRLWVREPWIEWDECEYRYQAEALTNPPPWWVATATKHQRWKPAMYMPRNAARLFLDVIAVRPERLLDITEADAQAEGFSDRANFLAFWNTLYAKKPQLQVKRNPWTWVYGFNAI